MKKVIVLALSALCTIMSISQENEPKGLDLVFVAEFESYDSWLNEAFIVDAERRSNFCDEKLTKYGKINENKAIIYLNNFDMSRMPEFASDKEMIALMEKNKVEHTEVYHLAPMSPEVMGSTADLFFMISFDDYNTWYKKAFVADRKRRSNYCDDTKTKVAQVDENNAMVILYQFDLTKLQDFVSDKKFQKLEKKFNVSNQPFVLRAL